MKISAKIRIFKFKNNFNFKFLKKKKIDKVCGRVGAGCNVKGHEKMVEDQKSYFEFICYSFLITWSLHHSN